MTFPATDQQLLDVSFLGEYQGLKPLNHSSIALANSITVKSGAGYLFGFEVYSNKASAQFIQVFDSATLPADGATPVCVFTVAATANLPIQWVPWRTFLNGCVMCNSSTAATKTIASADCFFDVQYL